MNYRFFSKSLSLLLVAPSVTWAANVAVEGVPVSPTAMVNEHKLVLNGAGYHQRSAAKSYVLALYAAEKKNNLDDLKKQGGAKRIQLQPLSELNGTAFSKYFMQDFAAASSKAEFAKLIEEVASVGALYSGLPKVTPNDVLAIDWVPEKGLLFSKNGKPVVAGMFNPYLNTPNSKLLYQIWLRMYAGPALPQELQNNLMGLSTSMQTAAAVVKAP
jgi:Chalcone isomerase-like